MDDREMVAAIAAGDPDGDPAGLADAYDTYAESLYGYCRMMLSEPEDAEYVLQDTFVIAAARLGGLRDPRKLRPWLYAVAHNECHLRLGATEADLDEADDLADPVGLSADDSAERAELRRLIRAALDGLNPAEREVIELGLRHDLHGADLAAVLGVPRNQAHALASRARGQLEKALGVLLVARTGRRACPKLDMLLDGWDGRLTLLTRKRVSRHIDQCDVCTDRKRGALRPAALYGMAPLAALPRGLRAEVLELCADVSPLSQSYRRDVAQSAGPFRPSGFPESARPPRPRMLALAGIAAAAGVVIAIAATGIITVLALSGSHPPGAAAARSGSPSGTAGASVTASAGSAGGAAPSLSPAASAPAVTSAPPPVAAPSASPIEAKPSPSATSSRPVSPTPAPSRATPTPTPTPPSTATATPTSTATATATPTSTFTFPG
jgi:RNA polymerase sigma factor (sigma-70 family)